MVDRSIEDQSNVGASTFHASDKKNVTVGINQHTAFQPSG
jgi:hypothetical protein